MNLDKDWKFHRGDIDSTNALVEWRNVSIPHDWSIEDIPGTNSPFDSLAQFGKGSGFTVGGISWYKCELPSADITPNKEVYLMFEGVYMEADVWVNHKHVRTHPYGYTSFFIKITDELNTDGAPNQIKVKVRNEHPVRWYSGSGIYRPVWLIVCNPVHIEQWGTFIHSEVVDRNTALVSISTELVNDFNDNKLADVLYEVVHENTVIASTTQKGIELIPQQETKISDKIKIDNPQLWSAATPSLYSLKTTVFIDGKAIDHTVEKFGIRAIKADSKKGLFVNGEPVKLLGGNMHHDNGPLGACAYDDAEVRRVQLMKNNGFNAIRTSHNPPSVAFLNACDSIGMYVIDELYDGWFADGAKRPYYDNEIEEMFEDEITRFVRRDRNHPSVIMWSTGNEILWKQTPRAYTLQQSMVDVFKQIDSTRLVTHAINYWPTYPLNKQNWDTVIANYAAPLDIVGYNYMPSKYESDYEKYPHRLIMGSESDNVDMFEYQSKMLSLDYVIGDFIWTGFDYIGEASTGWMRKGTYPWKLAFCGDIDICGFKRPQSYYREMLWGTLPQKVVAFVQNPMPSFPFEIDGGWFFADVYPSWTWEGYEGKVLKVDVYSKEEEVAIFVNGQEVDRKNNSTANKYIVSFDVAYQPGKLEAVAYTNGIAVDTFSIQTAQKAEKIKLTPDKSVLSPNGSNLCFITIEITDGNNIRRPLDMTQIELELEGPAELIGFGSANPISNESFQQYKRTTFEGRCLAIIKSNYKKGEIRIRAKSEGLNETEIKLISK